MPPVVQLSGVVKAYGALRPLRIESLLLAPQDRLAIFGIDRPGAEVLINLVTGATLPDSGEIHIFGRPTGNIENSDEWLQMVDRFGILSDRAVLLDPLSVVQNLAMPFSLNIEPPSPDLRAKALALAADVGLHHDMADLKVGTLDGAARARVRLARAVALEPEVLLLEHPTAHVERPAVAAFGRVVRAVAGSHRAAVLAITADDEFAAALDARVLMLDAASGRLSERRQRSWFTRRTK
jgi:ABC-type transporter Mla maintaining outer membrane lipid asymmetry ATPase subunit MlaF